MVLKKVYMKDVLAQSLIPVPWALANADGDKQGYTCQGT